MKKYRIHWRVIKTGVTGHGPGTYSKDQAQHWADVFNRNYKDIITHWIEEVKDERPND